MAITVNVGQFPSRDGVRPVTLEDGSTVAAALASASISAEGFDIRVNGQNATVDQPLAAGDSVVLVRKIKGNSEPVKASEIRVWQADPANYVA